MTRRLTLAALVLAALPLAPLHAERLFDIDGPMELYIWLTAKPGQEAAMDWLAAGGFDPVFGARPLKRVLQRQVENKLAEELLSGWIQEGDTVLIDLAANKSGLTFEIEKHPEVLEA